MLLDEVIFGALSPLLVHYSAVYHLSKLDSGFLVACGMIGYLLGSAFAPALVNITTLKPMVMIGVACAVAGALMMGLAESIMVLDAARLLQGFASALMWIGGLTWTLRVNDGQRTAGALSLVFALSNLGSTVGPLVGLMALKVGFTPVFSCLAAFFLALLIPISLLPAPSRLASPGNHLSVLVRTRAVRSALMVKVTAGALYGATLALLPLLLAREGATSGQTTIVFLVGAAVSIPMAWVIGRICDRIGAWQGTRWFVGLMALVALALPLVGSWAALVAMSVILLALVGSYGVPTNAAFSLAAKPNPETGVRQIELMSWSMLTSGVGFVLGAMIASLLTQAGSYALAFGFVAAVVLVAIARTSTSARLARDT